MISEHEIKIIQYAAFFCYCLFEYFLGKTKITKAASLIELVLLLAITIVKFLFNKLFKKEKKDGSIKS
jgi:hypothetical protein